MNTRSLLSTLWIFLTVNYIFCDVFTLMHAEDLRALLTGTVGGVVLSQEFLLSFAVILELPMLMIVLSRTAGFKSARLLNMTVGILMTLVQAWSLTGGTVSMHYIFFSIVEISTSAFIAWYAWKWKE